MDKDSFNYEEAEKVIEDLVRIKGRKYSKRYLDVDDIAQEIRIKCWKILDKFCPEKGQSLKTFLNVATENHLRNCIRDNFGTFSPPHKKDAEYFVDGRPTAKALGDPLVQKYLLRFSRKRAVNFPASIEHCEIEKEDKHLFYDDTKAESIELDLSVRDILRDDDLIEGYEILMTGGRVSPVLKERIQFLISEYLGIGE